MTRGRYGYHRGLWIAALGCGWVIACAGSKRSASPEDEAGPETPPCMRGEATDGPCDAYLDPATGAVVQLGPRGVEVDVDISQVGGEPFATSSDTPATAGVCDTFADVLDVEPDVSELLVPGDWDLSAYTVYRPARMDEGERLPVLVWGNGICFPTEAYGTLLRYLASHGFIVVAPSSRLVVAGDDLVRGIDLVLAMDSDPDGPLYGHVDAARIGAMGHTEGAGGANNAARMDERIQAAILWNGVFPPSRQDLPYLATSAEYNQRAVTPEAMSSSLRAPGAYLFLHDSAGSGPLRGMLTPVLEPGRVMDVALQFWRMVLLDDAEATSWFAGDDCLLCEVGSVPQVQDYEFGATGF